MSDGADRLSSLQVAGRQRPGGWAPVTRFSVRLLLVLMLGGGGGALADHSKDHLASSVVPESGFDLQKALGQPADDGVNEFLNPEIAFMLSTDARDAYKVVARFDIADGYYLYRDRFNFAVSGAPSVVLDFAQLPDGKEKEDPYFGRTQVYYSSVEAVLRLQRGTTGPVPLTVEVGYQGCADAGLCYPPMKQSVTLTLPATPIQ
jgi:thiol:disulfide interchange protein